MWRCYTRSMTERSLSLGPVARKFWNPKIICENSFSHYHPKAWHSWPSKRVKVVRKHFHFIKIRIKTILEDKNRTFLMHRILKLEASAEHTQFRNFLGERIIFNSNNFFDS